LNRRRPTFQNGVPGLSSIDRQVIQEITGPRNLQGADDDFEPTVDFDFDWRTAPSARNSLTPRRACKRIVLARRSAVSASAM
jgi:hypothetical protein